MRPIVYIAMAIFAVSCSKEAEYDAEGTFEATEVVISAEANGKILNFDVEEGTEVKADRPIGTIDSIQLHLQRKQLIAQQSALLGSRPDVKKQVASLRDEIAKQQSELRRVDNMLKDGAATKKQRDDIESHIKILESRLDATLSTLDKNTTTINNNSAALEAQIAALDDRIAKCRIASPIDGTVLVKYAEAGELASVGRALMKVANLDNMYLRAYFTSEQLSQIAIGDKVKVVADFGGEERYDYDGRIAWIASESEFTPKTIQTRESRANLVYAVKVAVVNDGRLKIGLSGEVVL